MKSNSAMPQLYFTIRDSPLAYESYQTYITGHIQIFTANTAFAGHVVLKAFFFVQNLPSSLDFSLSLQISVC